MKRKPKGKRGRPKVHKEPRHTLQVRIDANLYEKLRRYAFDHGDVSVNAIVGDALAEWWKRHGDDPQPLIEEELRKV